MKPARLLLLLIAVFAGGLAAFLATRGDAPQTQTAQTTGTNTNTQMDHVLVAKATLGIGQRLTPADLRWQKWPQDALQAEYITKANTPEAPKQLEGTVARFEIFAGEPINTAKLVRSDQGYLSAVLSKGKRAISLEVTPQTAAGGFIVPNDRVDVVKTVSTPGGQSTQILLENVRVLAIDRRLGEKGDSAKQATDGPPTTFDTKAIATLEVDPSQAEAVIGADKQGNLTLALRSILDYSEPVTLLGGNGDANQIRMIRFGQESVINSSADKPGTSMASPASLGDAVGNAGRETAGTLAASAIPTLSVSPGAGLGPAPTAAAASAEPVPQ